MSARFISTAFWIGPIKWGVLAAVLFVVSEAYGDTGLWGTIGFTKHADPGQYCSVNPGVSWLRRDADWLYSLGGHQKSDCDIGLVAVAAYMPWKWGRYRAGGAGMLLTDYGPPVFPAIAPSLSYEQKKYGADFIWLPGIIAHLRWRWSFD